MNSLRTNTTNTTVIPPETALNSVPCHYVVSADAFPEYAGITHSLPYFNQTPQDFCSGAGGY